MRRPVRRALIAATLLLSGLAVIPATEALAANGASAVYSLSSDWGTGYEAKYTITNGSTSSLTWRVEFDLPAGSTISSFWDSSVTKTANHVVAVGTWNATLAAGTSTSFGWIGAPGGTTPANCLLNGASCAAGGTTDTTPPTTPGTLSSPSQTASSVSLSWGASTDAGGSGLAGYNIYRNGATTPTAQTTSTTYTDSGLSAGTAYTYTVKARDGAGNLSAASNQISVTTSTATDTTPPTTPGTLSSPSQTASSVSLSWGASTDAGGSGLAGYNIYRNGATTPTAQTTSTTYTDSGLSAGTAYTYTVKARDGAGNLSAASNQISVTTSTATDTTPPTTPGTLSSPSKTATSVSLSWGASTDSGGSGLAGYNIYRNGATTPTAQTTSTSYTDGGLTASTAYTYTVKARDGAGNLSAASNQISVTTSTAPPGGSRKVGYFAQWGIYARNFKVKDVDQSGMASKLTTINYAFGNVSSDGKCFEANQTGVGDAWADYQTRFAAADTVNGVADVYNQPLAGNFNQLKELKAKYPNLKVDISLGGWTWSQYFSNAALPANRAAFVSSCIDLFIKGNLPLIGGEVQGGPGAAFGIFDGIDLDWEWPSSSGNTGNVVRPEDKANYVALIQEFRTQLNAYGASVGRTYDLTAFLPADLAKIDAGIDPAIFSNLTFATVQGYDFYGPWGPQTNNQSQLYNPAANPAPADQKFSVDAAVRKYIALGAPANKLVVGVPAYGRGWTNVPSANNGLYQNGTAATGTYEAGIEDYDVLKNRAGTIYRDTATGAMYKYDGTTFWSYDDPTLIAQKGQYVKSLGLGGLMIWSLDGDDGSLVTAMQTGLQ